MRVKENLKRIGYFWLPSESDRKIPGILSISDGGIIELEIFGFFGKDKRNPKPIKRIVGHIEKEGFITLDDCDYKSMSSAMSRTFHEVIKSSISVTRVFIGAAYREDAIPCFKSLTFSIEGIDEWVGISGIEEEYQLTRHSASISYELPANISLKLDNGMELFIAFAWKPDELGNTRKAGVIQKTFFI